MSNTENYKIKTQYLLELHWLSSILLIFTTTHKCQQDGSYIGLMYTFIYKDVTFTQHYVQFSPLHRPLKPVPSGFLIYMCTSYQYMYLQWDTPDITQIWMLILDLQSLGLQCFMYNQHTLFTQVMSLHTIMQSLYTNIIFKALNMKKIYEWQTTFTVTKYTIYNHI